MKKLLLIFYDSGIEDDVVELFEHLQLEGYTQLFEAQGKGKSGKRFGDAINPGTNNVAFVAVDEDGIPPLLAGLRELEKQFRKKPPIRVLSVTAETVY